MNTSTRDKDRLVLVVGGAGYVGSVLVQRLLSEGRRVRVLDGLLYGHGASLAGVYERPGFDFVRGDLRECSVLDRALAGVTDVVMLAGLVGDPVCKKYSELATLINEQGVQNAYRAAGAVGVERFIFTSTCSNYGLRESDELATEESALAPVSLYAEAKVAFERFVLEGDAESEMAPVILRISTAYGMSPRMRFDLTISEFTRALAAGEQLVVYDADTWRPYCHVADIAKAVSVMLEAPRDAIHREVFNVGHSDENYTKRMVVDAIGQCIDIDARVEYVEGGVDPRNYRVSFDKIADRLGFQPDHRVPTYVERLAEAVRGGVFDDFASRQGYYTNHTILDAERLVSGGAS